jgi:ribosome biogenesis GTPase
MLKGQIVRALSSFYYIKHEQEIYESKARGLFKLKEETPLVGDYVNFVLIDNNSGLITELLSRKNELKRPPISNVDQVLIVISGVDPEINTYTLDKFIIHIAQAGIPLILCFTKSDLLQNQTPIDDIINVYKNIGYQTIKSDFSVTDLEHLQLLLADKTTVLAGQSGVGKSTLLNRLIPAAEANIGGVSERLGRGKQTTREVQLYPIQSGGMVADTPGFSQLDFAEIEAEDLSSLFIEFSKYAENCRFRGCKHHNEPGCAVKAAVAEGKIVTWRYENYLSFLNEITERDEQKWR